jgi:hypothetical protein
MHFMARKPTQEPVAEKEWTPESIRAAVRKVRRTLTDVEAFDPKKVTRQFDPTVSSLQISIRQMVTDVFGHDSRLYRDYQSAAALDMAGINVGGTSLPKVIQGLEQGKERSITLLKSAIKFFERKMEDDFPGEAIESDPRIARAGIAQAGAAMAGYGGVVYGGPGLGYSGPGLVGAHAQGVAGDIRVSIQNDTPTGGVIIAESPSEDRFSELLGRVALLEASLRQLRREAHTSAGEREIGPGHNQGPEFDPVPAEELGDVDDLIALLKQQGPVPPADPTELAEQSQKASQVSGKIKQYLDNFAIEAFKGAGGEIGKRLAQAPIWVAVYHGIDRVTEVLALWLTHAPH